MLTCCRSHHCHKQYHNQVHCCSQHQCVIFWIMIVISAITFISIPSVELLYDVCVGICTMHLICSHMALADIHRHISTTRVLNNTHLLSCSCLQCEAGFRESSVCSTIAMKNLHIISHGFEECASHQPGFLANVCLISRSSQQCASLSRACHHCLSDRSGIHLQCSSQQPGFSMHLYSGVYGGSRHATR